jgi:hypothetical protein
MRMARAAREVTKDNTPQEYIISSLQQVHSQTNRTKGGVRGCEGVEKGVRG